MFIFIFFCALGLCAIIFEAGRRVGMKDGYQQCREDYQI